MQEIFFVNWKLIRLWHLQYTECIVLMQNYDVTEDFFRDMQTEFQNWEASAASQGKPKSLWEELAVCSLHYI